MKTTDFINLNAASTSKTITGLQQLLADFQVFYTNLRGFHWNIKGKDFFVLHKEFENMYNDIAEKVDEVAERIVTLGGVPANKFSDYLKIAGLSEVDHVSNGSEALKNILDSLGYFIALERSVLGTASQGKDEVTVSILTDYLKDQEKRVWMLTAYAVE